jgi:hypothetical protein
MRGYPSRPVAGAFVAARTLTVDTAAGKLALHTVRDAVYASLCPWLVKALTPGLTGDPTEEQVEAAEAAVVAGAVVLEIEVVLKSGPPVILAYLAESDGDDGLQLVGTAYLTCDSDVPVRGMIWPNIAEAEGWYWGTDGQGEATVEVSVGFSVLPQDAETARLLK